MRLTMAQVVNKPAAVGHRLRLLVGQTRGGAEWAPITRPTLPRVAAARRPWWGARGAASCTRAGSCLAIVASAYENPRGLSEEGGMTSC